VKRQKKYSPQKFTGKKFSFPASEERQERQSLYTKSWSNYRFRFLHHNPTCYACGISKATTVDHCVAHKGNKELFWKVDNYIPLCKLCHDRITAYFDRHSSARIEDKMKWIAARREENGVTTKVKIVPFKGENITS